MTNLAMTTEKHDLIVIFTAVWHDNLNIHQKDRTPRTLTAVQRLLITFSKRDVIAAYLALVWSSGSLVRSQIDISLLL